MFLFELHNILYVHTIVHVVIFEAFAVSHSILLYLPIPSLNIIWRCHLEFEF
jgi:hypothetical protein